MTKVVVIGSCMVDFVCYAPRLPKPGETVIAHKFVQGYGGKGANQSLSAVRLGATTAMIARVGDDKYGVEYREILADNKVNVEHVSITKDCSCGIAQITVGEDGENQIAIVTGANMRLSIEDVEAAKSLTENAKVLLFQLETPLDINIQIMKRYKGKVKCIVNGAPPHKNLDPRIYQLCDVFCLNETEAEIMSGVPVESITDATIAVGNFLQKGCPSVIITLGHNGAVFATQELPTPVHVPTNKVTPVDTTGAGDCFVGALAYFMAYHEDLKLNEIIRRACHIASVSVQTLGTHASFPYRRDLPDELFR